MTNDIPIFKTIQGDIEPPINKLMRELAEQSILIPAFIPKGARKSIEIAQEIECLKEKLKQLIGKDEGEKFYQLIHNEAISQPEITNSYYIKRALIDKIIEIQSQTKLEDS